MRYRLIDVIVVVALLAVTFAALRHPNELVFACFQSGFATIMIVVAIFAISGRPPHSKALGTFVGTAVLYQLLHVYARGLPGMGLDYLFWEMFPHDVGNDTSMDFTYFVGIGQLGVAMLVGLVSAQFVRITTAGVAPQG